MARRADRGPFVHRTPSTDDDLPPAERWDERYRARLAEAMPGEEPHPFLLELGDQLPVNGRALDVASGLGPNAIWLARRGLRVTAVDVSQVACDHLTARASALGLPITVVCCDLEREPLPEGPFDLIVNTRYLQRDLAPQMEQVLVPGGLLVFTTFVGADGVALVRSGFMLQRGELPMLFPNLEPILFREDGVETERASAFLLDRRSPTQS